MQNNAGLVSIIVPVYNAELYIRRCINSILQQSYTNFEILIINDGSTDNTLNILKELKLLDERIHIFNQSNKGVSAARNVGIENIKGKFFTFVDADDFLESDMLNSAVECIQESESDVVTYGWKKIDNKSKLIEACSENDEIVISSEKIINKILENYSAYGGGYPWNKLWKISDSLKPLYFDSSLSYFEDLEWVVRMMLQVQKMQILSKCLYNYMVYPTSVTNNPKNKERNELGYHMSVKLIIQNLDLIPVLKDRFEERYSSEIVNGIVHAQRNNWKCVEEYLWKELLLKWKKIIKMNLPIKVKIRCLRLVLLKKVKNEKDKCNCASI